MFCISLRPYRTVELVHAPPVVAACVRRLANEVNGLYAREENFEIRSNEKLGVLQFRMSFALFGTENKKKSTLGNLFCIRLLEELHKMGFDLQISSDLIRDSLSTG